MTKKEKDLDAWWRDIQAIDDADLQIGYRVTPDSVLIEKFSEKPVGRTARKRSASAKKRVRKKAR